MYESVDYDRSFRKSQYEPESLGVTLHTAATEFFNEALEMILAVVVGNFFTNLDIFLGDDKDPTATVDRLSIRTAGVIGIARRIVARAAIDIPFGIHIEHIAVIPLVTLTRRDAFTDIFDDGRPLLYRRQSKETQAGARAFYLDIGGLLFCLFHREKII